LAKNAYKFQSKFVLLYSICEVHPKFEEDDPFDSDLEAQPVTIGTIDEVEIKRCIKMCHRKIK
jgi:hypothetical protein